jgi:hypothetical protein
MVHLNYLDSFYVDSLSNPFRKPSGPFFLCLFLGFALCIDLLAGIKMSHSSLPCLPVKDNHLPISPDCLIVSI